MCAWNEYAAIMCVKEFAAKHFTRPTKRYGLQRLKNVCKDVMASRRHSPHKNFKFELRFLKWSEDEETFVVH